MSKKKKRYYTRKENYYNTDLTDSRQQFLLIFFDEKSEYQVKEINGFFLEKRWNGTSNRWEVAIYSRESWQKVLDWKSRQKSVGNLFNL